MLQHPVIYPILNHRWHQIHIPSNCPAMSTRSSSIFARWDRWLLVGSLNSCLIRSLPKSPATPLHVYSYMYVLCVFCAFVILGFSWIITAEPATSTRMATTSEPGIAMATAKAPDSESKLSSWTTIIIVIAIRQRKTRLWWWGLR